MADGGLATPWDKFDPSVFDPDPEEGESEEAAPDSGRSWGRVKWFTLDLVAATIWVYGFAKTFVGDFDAWIVERIAPSLEWMVDLRALIVLVLLSAFLLFSRRTRSRFWVPLYIAFYPLIVVLWKAPRFFYKRRSWPLLLGSLHVLVSTVRGIRFAVPTFTVFALSAVAVFVDAPDPVTAVAVIGLLGSWLATVSRALYLATRPSWFIRSQRRMVQKTLDSDAAWGLYSVEEWKDPAIETLDKQQASQLLARTSFGLTTYRAAQVWALKIDEYRRSGISLAYSVAAILLLVVQAVVTFAIANAGLHAIAPEQFSVSAGEPTPGLWIYYSFVSLYGNEISAISPAGGWAAGVSTAAGLSAGIVLLVLAVTLIFGVRQSRDDEVAEREIALVRERADAFADRLGQHHGVSIRQLQEYLVGVQYFLSGVLTYLLDELADEGSGPPT